MNMWRHLDNTHIYNEGHLDGLGYLLGPLETAATMMNYTNFSVGIYDSPVLLHKLLDIITDGLIYSLIEQQKINGKLKRVFMCDHMSHQVSRAVFDEFCFPYYKRIFDEFPEAVKIYHNEGNLLHIADEVLDFGANIIHFGVSTTKLKDVLRNKVILMGNLDPIEIMLKGNEEIVYEKQCNVL